MNKDGFSIVSDGVWKKGGKLWTEDICRRCEKPYLRRKDRKKQSFCSRNCRFGRKDDDNEIKISNEEADVIEGILLSDGSIVSSGTRHYSFSLSTTEEGFADFVSGELSFPLTKTVMGERVRHMKGRDYLCSRQFQVRSRSSITFTRMRTAWYPRGKKIVPSNVSLSPMSVLMWYLGDGSLDNGSGVILCTDSFSQADVLFLCSQLEDVGVPGASLSSKGRILIPNRYVFEFFEYIGWDIPVIGYAHKWNTIVRESYFGRRCRGCDNRFDASGNHHHWCSSPCHKKDWRRRQRKLKTAPHKVGG